MIRTLLLAALALTACQNSESKAPPAPAPNEAQISAMRDYCKIGEMPRDQQREAQKLWGWHNAGNKDVGPLWNNAALHKDPVAIATVRAAAVAAVGAGNCPILDALKDK